MLFHLCLASSDEIQSHVQYRGGVKGRRGEGKKKTVERKGRELRVLSNA
jgi:hypothetical protein